jgi:hypothetical protein
MNRKYRSMIAQLRSGVLPLEIETGRWRGTQLENRICQLCQVGCVEDEAHFLFSCNFYSNERLLFFQRIHTNFDNFSTAKKFEILMNESNILIFAKYLCEVYEKRKNRLFN